MKKKTDVSVRDGISSNIGNMPIAAQPKNKPVCPSFAISFIFSLASLNIYRPMANKAIHTPIPTITPILTAPFQILFPNTIIAQKQR